MSTIPPQLSLLGASPPPVLFQGKRVSDHVLASAVAALESFNLRAGSRVRPFKASGVATDELKRVIGAVTAFPDITEDGWRAAIDRALDDPWWSGAASVGCVFGPRVVQRHLFPGANVESIEARKQRERADRRSRRRAALNRVRGGGDSDGSGSMGGHLSAS